MRPICVERYRRMSRISIIDVHIDHLVNARPANQRCFSFDLEKPTAKSPWSLFWAHCITFIGVPRDGRYFCVLHVFLIKRKTRRDRMRAKFRATRYASRYTNQSPNKEMVGVRSCSVHAVPSTGRALVTFRFEIAKRWRGMRTTNTRHWAR
jgi:hypothetical protein